MPGRILIIVQNLPVPFDRRVWQEATSLQRAGFDVTVICPKKKMYTKGREVLEDVQIYRYPLLYEGNSGLLGYIIEFVYCWLATFALASWVFVRRPFQAIHACNPPDTYFALAALFRPWGVKFVFDHHDLSPEMYVAKGNPASGFLYRTLLWLERSTFRFADLIIAVNLSHRDIAVRRGRVAADSIVIVRSGPPRRWSEISQFRADLKQGKSKLVIYLGEMCQQDGVDHLVKAIVHYKKLHGADDTLFALIGGGPDQQRMQDLAHHLGVDDLTHFTGRIPDEQLWEYLSTADICVDPDPLSDWSDLSTMNKMIEYLAFGRPIVAFDLREHRNTAADAAVYVRDNNVEQMAIEIRNLLIDDDRRYRMEGIARKRFRQTLAWENSEEVLIAAYRRLLGQEEPSRRSSLAGEVLTSAPNNQQSHSGDSQGI